MSIRKIIVPLRCSERALGVPESRALLVASCVLRSRGAWQRVSGVLCRVHSRAMAAATSNGITLKGSVDIVTEFFGYSINRCASVIRSLEIMDCQHHVLRCRAADRWLTRLLVSCLPRYYLHSSSVAAFCTRCALPGSINLHVS